MSASDMADGGHTDEKRLQQVVRQNGIIPYGPCLALLERMVQESENGRSKGQQVRFDFCSTEGGMTERGTKSITEYMKLASMSSMQPLSNARLIFPTSHHSLN